MTNKTMKYTLIFILALFTFSICQAQELIKIRDTINHFEIGVPIGWKYGTPVNKSLAFMALRQKQSDDDQPRENFNINILSHYEIDLNKSYKQFLESIGQAKGFRILNQGDKIILNRKYKYLIEIHKNTITNENMTNYIFFTNDNGKILILTMVTISEKFEKFKETFDSISNSLIFKTTANNAQKKLLKNNE